MWADLPDREEAGSPNVIGAVALAAAGGRLATSGSTASPPTSSSSPRYAMRAAGGVPGLTIHGPASDDAAAQKVGVVPFTLDGIDHRARRRRPRLRARHRRAQRVLLRAALRRPPARAPPGGDAGRGADGGVAGMVRISFGGYSDSNDVDRVVDAVAQVAAGAVRSSYSPRARRLLGVRPTNPPDLGRAHRAGAQKWLGTRSF